jgi:pantoate--beta-alanine ligase
MEGVARPGHFEGVLTVVLKLLQIARADRAYFGKKDFQQLELVKGLVEAFFIPTTIVPCVTIRDADGLAFSSRNARLSVEDRERAARFPRILQSAASPKEAIERLKADGFTVEYVEVWEGRILGAVRVGGIRLIDNFRFQPEASEPSVSTPPWPEYQS